MQICRVRVDFTRAGAVRMAIERRCNAVSGNVSLAALGGEMWLTIKKSCKCICDDLNLIQIRI